MSIRMRSTSLEFSEFNEEGDQIFSEINITPLTDIFLVLLIIFMVTSSVMSQLGVSVQLPQASGKTANLQPKGVVLTVLSNGAMKLNQTEIANGDFLKLEALLKQILSQTSSRLVVLEGDKKVYLGLAVQVMDHARKAGAEKFAIAAELSR
ncbi:MAG: biopolymer transporter ExbD [Deltaproteobacteria bacterium]|nr:biopolymer transporter ExbD [Deltaproteobacteria bacterium]